MGFLHVTAVSKSWQERVHRKRGALVEHEHVTASGNDAPRIRI